MYLNNVAAQNRTLGQNYTGIPILTSMNCTDTASYVDMTMTLSSHCCMRHTHCVGFRLYHLSASSESRQLSTPLTILPRREKNFFVVLGVYIMIGFRFDIKSKQSAKNVLDLGASFPLLFRDTIWTCSKLLTNVVPSEGRNLADSTRWVWIVHCCFVSMTFHVYFYSQLFE